MTYAQLGAQLDAAIAADRAAQSSVTGFNYAALSAAGQARARVYQAAQALSVALHLMAGTLPQMALPTYTIPGGPYDQDPVSEADAYGTRVIPPPGAQPQP